MLAGLWGAHNYMDMAMAKKVKAKTTANHAVSFIFSDLLGNTTPQFSSFILQHNMFQPSGPDHMLNKTGKVLNDFHPLPSPESESQFKTKLTILEC